jgi:hypothetical protein
MLGPGAARSQDLDSAVVHYGDGVRAYFAGNSSRAEQSLSNALTTSSQDPRIYYFRALSLLRQGRTAEARGDMMVGASLEAQHPQRFAVGAALERVQGRDRLLLEQYRRQARADAGLNGAARGQAITNEPPGALRQRLVIPLDEYLRPGAPQPAGAMESATPRTFAPAAPQRPTAGSGQAPATSEDPFRDDPQRPADRTPAAPPALTPPPATAPADSGELFEGAATESAQPETTMPAPTTTPAEAPLESEDDPFASPSTNSGNWPAWVRRAMLV